MLRILRDNLEFVITFVFPFLFLLADMLVRFGLRIDPTDAGADMALYAATTFLTLFIEDLRVEFSQIDSATKAVARDPKDLMIIFMSVGFFMLLWFVALLFVSDSNPLYQAFPAILILRTAIVLGIGIGTIFAAGRLLYELLRLDVR